MNIFNEISNVVCEILHERGVETWTTYKLVYEIVVDPTISYTKKCNGYIEYVHCDKEDEVHYRIVLGDVHHGRDKRAWAETLAHEICHSLSFTEYAYDIPYDQRPAEIEAREVAEEAIKRLEPQKYGWRNARIPNYQYWEKKMKRRWWEHLF